MNNTIAFAGETLKHKSYEYGKDTKTLETLTYYRSNSDAVRISDSCTGYDIALCTETVIHAAKKTLNDTSISLQGFTGEGIEAAKILYEKGAVIKAVNNAEGGLYCPMGIDIHDLITHLKTGKSISSYQKLGIFNVTKENILFVPCDVLISTGSTAKISKDNYMHLKCKFLIKCSDFATAAMNDQYLLDNGIKVVHMV